MKKIIITGAPCSGKTSLLNELKLNGLATIQESATLLISQEISGENKILPWTTPREFLNRVYALQLQQENSYSQNSEIVFLDRSLVDCIAYYYFYNLEIPQELPELVKQARYSDVFFLELLPEKYWHQTLVSRPRKLSYRDAIELQSLLAITYKDRGFKVIKIPILPIGMRIKAILEYLRF